MTRFLSIVLVLAFSACGDDGGGGMADATPGEDAWVDPTIDAGPPPDYGLDDIDRTADPACEASWMVAAQIVVNDENGRPAGGTRTRLCVQNTGSPRFACGEYTDTWVDGSVTLIVPEGNRCVSRAAVQYGGQTAEVITGYCRFDLEELSSAVISVETPYVVYETFAPEDLPAEGDRNMERTVTFHDGLEVDIIPAELDGDYNALRARRIPLREDPCFAQGLSMPFLGMWAFSPEMSVIIPEDVEDGGFVVRFPNVGGLGAGTFAQAMYLEGFAASMEDARVPPVTLRVIGEGVAGAGVIDGGRGILLPRFTWVGYREKPFRVDP